MVRNRQPQPTPTPLRLWLDTHDVSIEEMARRCSVSLATMGEFSRGVRLPADEMKLRIRDETKLWELEQGRRDAAGLDPTSWVTWLDKSPVRPERSRRKGRD